MLNLHPYIKIKTAPLAGFTGYLAAGPSIGLLPQIWYNQVREMSNGVSLLVVNHYTGGAAWGVTSALGGSYRFSRRFAAFADLKFAWQTYTPTVWENAPGNEYDLLDNYTVDTMTGEGGGILKSTYNLSSLGLFAGLSYQFN